MKEVNEEIPHFYAPYMLVWAPLLELCYQFWGIHLIRVYPLVVGIRVSDSLDQILHFAVVPSYPRI